MANLTELARLGAAVRIKELEAEIEHLRKLTGGLTLRANSQQTASTAQTIASTRPTRKRSHMSAAARKAQSARMKKYWAERRKAKKG